mgnify:FL=1
MSSMLEQAIVDAAALREAALKSAEQAVIERYAPEIKAAMAALLENTSPRFSRGQMVRHEGRLATVTVENDDGRVGIQEVDGGKTYLVQEADIVEAGDTLLQEEEVEEGMDPKDGSSNAPLAALDLEQEGIQEHEQVIFEFTAADFLEEEAAGGDDALDSMASIGAGEDEADQLGSTGTGEAPEDGGIDKDLALQEVLDEDKTLQELVDILNEFQEEEEEDEPVLKVDMQGDEKDGQFRTDKGTLEYYQEMEKAREEAGETKAELDAKVEELGEVKNLFKQQTNKFTQIINDLNEKLQSTLLSNAKLLYSNRALNDASLNERQKSKIVEAINKAHSVEEAKNLHETLRVTVGQSRQRGPKSLNETVSRKSNLSSMLTSKKQDTEPVDNFSERMRKLAGLK